MKKLIIYLGFTSIVAISPVNAETAEGARTSLDCFSNLTGKFSVQYETYIPDFGLRQEQIVQGSSVVTSKEEAGWYDLDPNQKAEANLYIYLGSLNIEVPNAAIDWSLPETEFECFGRPHSMGFHAIINRDSLNGTVDVIMPEMNPKMMGDGEWRQNWVLMGASGERIDCSRLLEKFFNSQSKQIQCHHNLVK